MLPKLIRWPPIAEGSQAPRLSLTADDGTWVQLPDFKGNLNVVLLFFRSLKDEATDAWLKDFDRRREQFEELETAIFGVTNHKTERLREYRSELGIDIYLLFDPLALNARSFQCSGRIRPYCKDSTVVVDKQGHISLSRRGLVSPGEVLAHVADIEGTEVPSEQPDADERHGFSTVRNPGQAADEVRHVDSHKALELLGEDDSPYVLVDVRTLHEFEADRSPLSVHIPVDEVPHRYQELGQTTHIICVCQSGGRSAQAAEFLTSIGCSEIYNVIGGMSSWEGERTSGSAQE